MSGQRKYYGQVINQIIDEHATDDLFAVIAEYTTGTNTKGTNTKSDKLDIKNNYMFKAPKHLSDKE